MNQIITDKSGKPIQATTAWIIALFTLGYMLPWAIAASRGKSNSGAVFLVNLLTGWTAIGWIIALVMACTSHQVAGIAPVATSPVGSAPQTVGTREVDVVGESQYGDSFAAFFSEQELAAADGTEKYSTATLIREPSNMYDPNAVQVRVADRLVGYLPRDEAAALAPALDRAGGRQEVKVRLWARNRDSGIFASARVWL